MKTIIKKVLRFSLNIFSTLRRDWEDPHLMMAAKKIILDPTWLSVESNFSLSDKEFRVYSQWGDDGIIQFLVSKLNVKNSKFIEFGVADYYESNTHFLLCNNNWSGYVIDGSSENIDTLKSSLIYWRYDLQAISAFVTAENINELLASSNFSEVGLLHIDLDGNDYWILKALNLSRYNPDILILEYNALFGSEREITIPYDPGFYRFSAHYSGQYFGSSIAALFHLAELNGYYFIGCNSSGNNAYFLKERFRTLVPETTLSAGFVQAKFRDARDEKGKLSFMSREESAKMIRGLPVFNIKTGQIEPF